MPRHITAEQERLIQKYHADGMNQTQIEKLTGVTRRTVRDHLQKAKVAAATAKVLPRDPNDPRPVMDIHDDNALATVIEDIMGGEGGARPSERIQAVGAALKVRSEGKGGNPAEEPITHEEEVRFRELVWRNRDWFMKMAGVSPDNCPICGHEFEDLDGEAQELADETEGTQDIS